MFESIEKETAESYRDIFDIRGQLYHRAMLEFPDVRTQEFQSVINEADISNNMRVVDVPSGGCYISRYLQDVDLIGLEVSRPFAEYAALQQQQVLLCEGDTFPLPDASVDRVLSIAGLHHVEDKRVMFSEMRRILKPDGKLIIADVAAGSPVQGFLDDFVGKYCETGHSGWYFGASTEQELLDSDVEIISSKRLNYLWCAANTNQLADFCKLLFGMTYADRKTVVRGISDFLGFSESEGGAGMHWQLQCYVGQRTPERTL